MAEHENSKTGLHSESITNPSFAGVDGSRVAYIWRVLTAAAIVIALILLVLLTWQVLNVLLVVFGGVLLAVFLRGLSGFVHRYTPLGERLSLMFVVISLAALAVGTGWLLAPSVSDQVRQISEDLPVAVEQIRESLEAYPWGRFIVGLIPEPQVFVDDMDQIVSQVGGAISRTLGGIVDFLVFVFVGLYLAYDPRMYVRGVVRLVPIARRDRAEEVLNTLGVELQWWLLARLISMLAVGVMVAVGLWLFDMPLVLILGLIAALLDFVPIVGPIIASIPAILLALLQSPMLAVYIALMYWVIQQIESYLITPVLHQQVVDLSPALVISAQVMMALLLGVMGLIFATPILLVVVVVVKLLYIEDMLGDPVEMRGTHNHGTEDRNA